MSIIMWGKKVLSNEIVSFIRTHFPDQAGEIGAALDMLIYSLIVTEEALIDKGNELFRKKEYEKGTGYMQKARKLNDISRELQRQLELFQLDDIAQVSEDERLENIEKTLPNYSEYEVDNTVAHTLHENYIHKRPYACELKDKKVLAREWKTVLLETCNILADINPAIITTFPDIPRLNGRISKYFLTGNPGSMRAPRKLRTIYLYVETNFSAIDIRNLLIKMLNHIKFQFPNSKYICGQIIPKSQS